MNLELHTLPHDGIIPGARGRKKQIIPRGTQVWCIVHERRHFYWACYTNQEHAAMVLKNLQDCAEGRARRSIPLHTLLAWNFKRSVPTRVCREK